jgi:hypothetical protein
VRLVGREEAAQLPDLPGQVRLAMREVAVAARKGRTGLEWIRAQPLPDGVRWPA